MVIVGGGEVTEAELFDIGLRASGTGKLTLWNGVVESVSCAAARKKALIVFPECDCSCSCSSQLFRWHKGLPATPSNICLRISRVLTHFGERADISPDNQRVAFMAKSFGDAMVIDLKSRAIHCLTCNVPGAAFLRVMHLVTGDYILIGPDHFEDIRTSRSRDNELWFLSKERGSKPVKLGQKMSEGAAISKKTLKIAFSQVDAQSPDLAPEASRLIVADVDLSGLGPNWSTRRRSTKVRTGAA